MAMLNNQRVISMFQGTWDSVELRRCPGTPPPRRQAWRPGRWDFSPRGNGGKYTMAGAHGFCLISIICLYLIIILLLIHTIYNIIYDVIYSITYIIWSYLICTYINMHICLKEYHGVKCYIMNIYIYANNAYIPGWNVSDSAIQYQHINWDPPPGRIQYLSFHMASQKIHFFLLGNQSSKNNKMGFHQCPFYSQTWVDHPLMIQFMALWVQI